MAEKLTILELNEKFTQFMHDNNIDASTLRLSSDGEEISVSFAYEPRERELPDFLKPFEVHEDIERMIWKGNTEKKTYEGARFELALKHWGNVQFEKYLIEKGFVDLDWEADPTHEEIKAIEAVRKAHWDTMWALPEFAELERQMNEDYA